MTESFFFRRWRINRWMRRGMVAGALCGIALGVYVDWYFVHGAGSRSLDAGEAHGLIMGLLGFPFSFAGGYTGRIGLILSVGATWALVGAALAGAAAVTRGGRTTPPTQRRGKE